MGKNKLKKKYMNIFGLLAFIGTGGGLIISTALHEENLYMTEILVIIGCFFAVSLIDHYKILTLEDKDEIK